MPQMEYLKQQIFIFSQFWKLKSKTKVLGGLVPPEVSLGLQKATFSLCLHVILFFVHASNDNCILKEGHHHDSCVVIK
jgi:hypothetical protein